jgi:hypothetical protein
MPEPILVEALSIQDWVEGLARVPAVEFTKDIVQRYILHNTILPTSLDPFTFFPFATLHAESYL